MEICLRVHRKAGKVGSTATVSGGVYWSYPILPFGIVVCTFFPTIYLKKAVYMSTCTGDWFGTVYLNVSNVYLFSSNRSWFFHCKRILIWTCFSLATQGPFLENLNNQWDRKAVVVYIQDSFADNMITWYCPWGGRKLFSLPHPYKYHLSSTSLRYGTERRVS